MCMCVCVCICCMEQFRRWASIRTLCHVFMCQCRLLSLYMCACVLMDIHNLTFVHVCSGCSALYVVAAVLCIGLANDQAENIAIKLNFVPLCS